MVHYMTIKCFRSGLARIGYNAAETERTRCMSFRASSSPVILSDSEESHVMGYEILRYRSE